MCHVSRNSTQLHYKYSYIVLVYSKTHIMVHIGLTRTVCSIRFTISRKKYSKQKWTIITLNECSIGKTWLIGRLKNVISFCRATYRVFLEPRKRHAVNVRKRQKCSFLSSIAGLRYSLRALFGTLRTYFRERLKMAEINFNGIEWHFAAMLPLVAFLLVSKGEFLGGCLGGLSEFLGHRANSKGTLPPGNNLSVG